MRNFDLTVQQRTYSLVSLVSPDTFSFGSGDTIEFGDGSEVDAGDVIVEATTINLSV